MIEHVQRILSWCHNTLRNEEGLSPLDAFKELNKLLFMKWIIERERDMEFYRDTIYKGMVIDDPGLLQSIYSHVCNHMNSEGFYLSNDLRVSPNTCTIVFNILRGIDMNVPLIELGDGYDKFVAITLNRQSMIRLFNKDIADYMIDIADLRMGEIIVDYSCGVGTLLSSVYKSQKGKGVIPIYGCDCDSLMTQTTKISLLLHGCHQSRIKYCRDISKSDLPMPDVILMSVPHGGKINGMNTDIVLIKHAIDNLKYGGKAVLMVSDMVLSGYQYEDVRFILKSFGSILNITSLPESVVKYGDIKSKCSIIVFKKEGHTRGGTVMLSKIEKIGISNVGLPIDRNDLKEIAPYVKKWVQYGEFSSHPQLSYVDVDHFNIFEVDNIFAKVKATYSGKYPLIGLGTLFVVRERNRERVEDDKSYTRITVRKNQHDIVRRDIVKGSAIKGRYLTPVHAGQLILSRIGAKDGAIGILPRELDGAYVTDEFYVIDINKDKVHPYFLLLILTSEKYRSIFKGLSRGASGLSRLSYNDLFNLTVPLPPLNEQIEMVGDMESNRTQINRMEEKWIADLKRFNNNMFGL